MKGERKVIEKVHLDDLDVFDTYKERKGEREKGTGHARHRYTTGGQGPVSGASRDPTQRAGKTQRASRDPTQRAGKTQRASRDPHPVGRDPHLLGRQPGHQGERASVKETSHIQRLKPVHQGCMVITKSKTVLTA